MLEHEAINRALGAPSRDDLAREALLYLGARRTVNRHAVSLPTLGVMTLLEIVESPYVMGGKPAADDTALAYFLLTMQSAGVAPVMAGSANRFEGVRQAAGFFCEARKVNESELAVIGAIISDDMASGITGFRFFPPGKNESPDDLRFGAEWLANIEHQMCGIMGYAREAVLWQIPLLVIGFLSARIAQYNGVKNVGRENTLDWDEANKLLRSKNE